jgi:hypothetical protein
MHAAPGPGKKNMLPAIISRTCIITFSFTKRMAADPVIVVSAHSRPKSLKRLLASVAQAVYDGDPVELVISIDKSDSEDVLQAAEQFEWRHGSKKIIHHAEHLGLKAHLLSCGDMSATYGAIILLEDDLLVSPYFYHYAKQAQAFYENDPHIAGISLYNYQVSESSFYPFNAIDDGSDVYFMQVASSWGQLWTSAQWAAFKAWHAANPELPASPDIPAYLQAWGAHSWKKHFIHYLTSTEKYFVFPRVSLTTHFGDSGTHSASGNLFHVPLQLSQKQFRFTALQRSGARYDAWFELLPACLTAFNQTLMPYHYAVDLQGTKSIGSLDCDHVLTSQQAKDPVLSFGLDLLPFEMNVALNIQGSGIGLYKIKDTVFTPAALKTRNLLHEQKKEDQAGISVIVPLVAHDLEKIRKTLLSFAEQATENKECILVTREPLDMPLKKMIDACGVPVKVVRAEAGLSLEQLAGSGFEKANKGILTWMLPGNTFTADALPNAQKIFSAYSNISWISGVEESAGDGAGLNVRSYRLTAAEAYRRLEKGTLAISMEQHFFRKHCLAPAGRDFSFERLFFHCIQLYQLFIVVSKLGTKAGPDLLMNTAEQKRLLKAYSFLRQKASPGSAAIDFFLNVFFARSHMSQWLYPALNKFPNVLRYDAVHDTFYLSGH